MSVSTSSVEIEELVTVANGRRRTRLLTPQDVADVVADVEAGKNWSWCHGGEVLNAYAHKALTSAAFVARVDDGIYVQVSEVDAHGFRPSKLDPVLARIASSKPEVVQTKLREWSKSPNVVRLDKSTTN